MKTLQDIKGHEDVKRAIKIALAGNHSIVFIAFKDKFAIGNEFVNAFKDIAGKINEIIPDNKINVQTDCLSPCPCGYHTDPRNECTCSMEELLKYAKKYSQVRQYDMGIQINNSFNLNACDNDEEIIKECLINREKIEPSRALSNDIKQYLNKLNSFNLFKLINIAQTIAKMENSRMIQMQHVCEAFKYYIRNPYDYY
jgi:predicted ATPase with chaperone activity